MHYRFLLKSRKRVFPTIQQKTFPSQTDKLKNEKSYRNKQQTVLAEKHGTATANWFMQINRKTSAFSILQQQQPIRQDRSGGNRIHYTYLQETTATQEFY